jgi:hypothetical protein
MHCYLPLADSVGFSTKFEGSEDRDSADINPPILSINRPHVTLKHFRYVIGGFDLPSQCRK